MIVLKPRKSVSLLMTLLTPLVAIALTLVVFSRVGVSMYICRVWANQIIPIRCAHA